MNKKTGARASRFVYVLCFNGKSFERHLYSMCSIKRHIGRISLS